MSATVVELKASDDKNVEGSSEQAISEEIRSAKDDSDIAKKDALVSDTEVKAGPPLYNGDDDELPENPIIVTGADAAQYLLPLRDDGEPSLTFRAIFLATLLSGFQAVMSQIYYVSLNDFRGPIKTCYPRFLGFLAFADFSISSNRLILPSKEHLSSSLPTSWATPGRLSSPAAID